MLDFEAKIHQIQSSGLALRPFVPQYSALRASKFGPSGFNLPPQILKASAVPGGKRRKAECHQHNGGGQRKGKR